MKRTLKSNHQNEKIELRKNGIYLVEGGRPAVRIAPPILVTAFATSPQGRALSHIEFKTRRNKWKMEFVASAILTGQSREFVSFLANLGYRWPADNKKLWPRIIAALSMVTPKRDIRIVHVPGWHRRSFVLPRECYGPKGPHRKRLQISESSTVRLGLFRQSGTLDKWQKYVAKPCTHSTRAMLAVASNFAAPNLRTLGLPSFGFNFSGETSRGKTLLLRLAASTAGLNSDAGPDTWDGTPTAFEQRALGHRDCIVPLDDIGYLGEEPGAMTKFVTFRLAGNRGKARAGQYVAAQNVVDSDWRVIFLSTSEVPLWDQLGQAGRRPIRGEDVRMINIRACVSDRRDVFDGPRASEVVGDTVEKRRLFVHRQERCARRHQGEAFRAFLTKRAQDADARATLSKYMTEFCRAAPTLEPLPWLGRIQKCFAAIYASAAQAIDYGILPWKKPGALNAIKACMGDAMKQLVAHSAGSGRLDSRTRPSDEDMLEEFKQRVDTAKFVRLRLDRRKAKMSQARIKQADGILRPTKPGKVEYFLFSRTMDTWFPEVEVRQRLTRLLRSRRVLKKGRRSDTKTLQVKIAALDRKVSCYGLTLKRLADLH